MFHINDNIKYAWHHLRTCLQSPHICHSFRRSINKIKNAGLAPDEKREKLKSIIQNKYNHLPPDQKQLILQTISMRDKNEKNQAISALPKDTQWMINAKEVTTAPIWEF